LLSPAHRGAISEWRYLEKLLDVVRPDEQLKWRGPERERLNNLPLNETAKPLIGDAETPRRFGHGQRGRLGP
jgi:hypothetical protein